MEYASNLAAETTGFTPATSCEGCGNTDNLNADKKFCPECGFPVNASPEEKKKFRAQLSVKIIELEAQRGKINRVQIYLFITAALTLIMGFVMGATDEEGGGMILLVINIILSLAFMALGLLVKKNPLPVCVIALSLYGSIVLLNAFADPVTIVKGIIFKVLIISALIYGIIAARHIKNLEAELAQFKKMKLT